MAREARDIAEELGYSTFFVARDEAEFAAIDRRDEVILESDIGKYCELSFIIGIGECALRSKIANHYSGAINFINLIHPSATFGRYQREHIESKRGLIICAGSRFTSDVTVGNFGIYNINSSVSHDCEIGDFVTICPHACILGNVEIHDGVWVGANATVNQGDGTNKTKIGANTVIGSGSVVLDSCEPNSIYAGIPARKIN